MEEVAAIKADRIATGCNPDKGWGGAAARANEKDRTAAAVPIRGLQNVHARVGRDAYDL